jgi:hypothetical protein
MIVGLYLENINQLEKIKTIHCSREVRVTWAAVNVNLVGQGSPQIRGDYWLISSLPSDDKGCLQCVYVPNSHEDCVGRL